MEGFEELHKMIRLLRCINMPVSSIHPGLYSKLLKECELVTYKVTGTRPTLSVECDTKVNIQHIIESVEAGLFAEGDVDMMTALDIYAMEHLCSTSMEAAQSLLQNDAPGYIRMLNSNHPTDAYFSMFHQFDRIGRDQTGKIVSIETPSCLYTG